MGKHRGEQKKTSPEQPSPCEVRSRLSLSFENLEARVRGPRVFAHSEIELTAELEAFGATSILVYLDDISRVEVTKHCLSFLVLCHKALTVDHDAVSCECPNANMQLVQARPVLVLL